MTHASFEEFNLSNLTKINSPLLSIDWIKNRIIAVHLD